MLVLTDTRLSLGTRNRNSVVWVAWGLDVDGWSAAVTMESFSASRS